MHFLLFHRKSKTKAPWIALGLLLLWFGLTGESIAQEAGPEKPKKEKPDYSSLPKNPRKAAILSAILPGVGQVYNNKAWKVPLIYSGLAIDIYFIGYNNRRYNVFNDALEAFDNGDATQFPSLNREALVRNIDYWRRNRDLTILLLGVIYALNIVDANVDAHLSGFEITDDLALDVRPHLESFSTKNNSLGVSFKLKF